jgi:hypothetical protein
MMEENLEQSCVFLFFLQGLKGQGVLFNTSSTVALEDTALYVLVNDTAFETDWCVIATLWLLHSYQSSDSITYLLQTSSY